jgi:hypothetical protein
VIGRMVVMCKVGIIDLFVSDEYEVGGTVGGKGEEWGEGK